MSRRLLFFCLFLSLSWGGFAQRPTDVAAIGERLAEYGRLSEEWKVDSLLDFISPRLFDFVPRQVLRSTFESMLEDEDVRIGFTCFTPDSIGATVRHDGVDYAPVHYSMTLTMTMLSEDYREADFMQDMAASLGANTQIDPTSHTLRQRKEKTLFAIRYAPDAPWYFVEYDASNPDLLNSLVPPGVRAELNIR